MSDRVELLGVGFDRMTQAEIVSAVFAALASGTGGWISTPNGHHLRETQRSPACRELIADASYVVADGMPLVWASRLQGTPLPERVPGSDLVWSVAAAAAREGRSLFLLGGDDGVAPRARSRFEEMIPGLKIAGLHCPPMGFERDPAELERVERLVVDAAPDLVYVGLGFPKQERLIQRLRVLLPDAWLLGIGVSLSFISEDQRRAPTWMQATGLEWIHRLIHEPRRLFRRYVREGIPFTLKLLTVSLAKRLTGRTRP